MSLFRQGLRSSLRQGRGVVLALAAAGLLGASARADDKKCNFAIPAGPAEETLHMFSEQAGIQFVYSVDKVRGVETNALKGEYTPRNGLDHLVEGTPLRVVQDGMTGALTVDRQASPKFSDSTDLVKKKIP